jgi:hypothetical protein
MSEGVTSFFRGRLPQARTQLERFASDPWGATADRRPYEWPLPNDPLCAVLAHLAIVEWIAGDVAEATNAADRALARAQTLSFPYGPFSVCYVKSLTALMRNVGGAHTSAAALAAELVETGERHGFVLWTLAGGIAGSIAASHLGRPGQTEALASLVDTWRTVLAADVWTPYWLTELASAHRSTGSIDEALSCLDEALHVAEETGSGFFSAETLRIRGELRCARGDLGGLDDLSGALTLARRQGAAMFAARAAHALDRLARR